MRFVDVTLDDSSPIRTLRFFFSAEDAEDAQRAQKE
jgi:hypothetical protein